VKFCITFNQDGELSAILQVSDIGIGSGDCSWFCIQCFFFRPIYSPFVIVTMGKLRIGLLPGLDLGKYPADISSD